MRPKTEAAFSSAADTGRATKPDFLVLLPLSRSKPSRCGPRVSVGVSSGKSRKGPHLPLKFCCRRAPKWKELCFGGETF